MTPITDPRRVLLDFVARFDTQREAADALGISKQYLSDMLINYNRGLSDRMLNKLGLRRVIVATRPLRKTDTAESPAP